MDIKKGLKNVGIALAVGVGMIWSVLKIPPKMVAWVFRHKIMTALIAGASLWGYNKVTQTESPLEKKIRLVQQVEKNPQQVTDKVKKEVMKEALVVQSQTNENETVHTVIDMPLNADKKDTIISTVGATRETVKTDLKPKPNEADTILSKKPLLSTPKYDLVNKDGERVAPAMERLQNLVKKMASDSGKPEQSGLKTLLIYSAYNTNNFSVVHLGYYKTKSPQKREYKLYYSTPTIEGVKYARETRFNIMFPEPGFQLGVQTGDYKIDLPEATDKVPSIVLDNKGGITVLKVDSFGNISATTPQESKNAVKRAENLLKAQADVISETFLVYPQREWLQASEKVWQKTPEPERKRLPRRQKVRLEH